MPRSFVEALKAKYCEEEDDDCTNYVHIVYTNRPRKSSSGEGDPELGYLKSVVLSMNRVTHAGIPPEGLSSLCPNIVDLDLSSNLIGCWQEIITIFKSLDNLKFVNLSGNKLQDPKGCLKNVHDSTFAVENLVLNSTDVSWENIVNIAGCLPYLRELHASKNGYEDIPVDSDVLCKCLHNLQILHLNDNGLDRWEQVAKLSLLPHLHTLILSENPLGDIDYNALTVTVRECRGDDDETTHDKTMETKVSKKEQDKKKTMDHIEIVGTILDTLITETLCNLMEPTATKMRHESLRDEASDPSADDSGMEDSHPNTPRHDHRKRSTSHGSQDGDHMELSDSGFGSNKTATAKHGDQKNTCHVSDGKLKSGGTIGESDTVRNPVSLDNPTSERINNTSTSPTEHSSDGDSPSDESMNKVNISTNKFAYFEITWDADDEAIGQESDADEEEVPEVKEDHGKVKGEEQSKDGFTGQCEVEMAFQNLQVLCLTDTRVSHWSHAGSLRLFPNLKSLRVKGIPFLREMDADERRKLLVASLPNVQILNGSEIMPDDREKSERFFIRHFCNHPEPPAWYEDLVKRHGNLKPLVDIDISRGFQPFAKLSFFFQGRCVCQDTIHVFDSIGQLRKYCANLVGKHHRSICLIHVPKSADAENPEPTELVCHSVPMSRYDIMDGDEIHIDVRAMNVIPHYILESRQKAAAMMAK